MIYFDNNATTRLAPKVFEAMRPFLDRAFGNPSSAHAAGREARKAVEDARQSVAELLGADAAEVVFTSGGTESDNWAIRGALDAAHGKRQIVTTRVEHEAVRNLCSQLERQGSIVTWLDVDEDGGLDLDQVRDAIGEDTAVVSIMLANNETGVLFPINDIAEIVKSRSSALVHVDGVNAVGKVAIDLSDGAVDLFSISAHKYHGPKGIGALYIRKGVELPSLAIGGGQESGRRAGTEAVHQIAGLGVAAKLAADLTSMEGVGTLRDRLEAEILRTIPNTTVNGIRDPGRRLPNTSNISFENLNGEALLARLDAAGICVSTGSACNAADHKASAVLQAMNVPFSRAMGSIRFSLGRYNTEDEVETVLGELGKIVKDLMSIGTGAG